MGGARGPLPIDMPPKKIRAGIVAQLRAGPSPPPSVIEPSKNSPQSPERVELFRRQLQEDDGPKQKKMPKR